MPPLTASRADVVVTPVDIDNGEPGNPKQCPIARAVRRALDIPEWMLVDVGGESDWIEVYPEGSKDEAESVYYRPLTDIEARIAVYDDTGLMNPFEFEMRRIESPA